MLRSIGRSVIFAVAVVFGVGLLYLIAAVIGALWRPTAIAASPSETSTQLVYIVWSPIHTDIVLPVKGETIDWQKALLAADDPVLLGDVSYLAFGWGSESFYKDVPTMADITPGVMVRALFLDTTVVHMTPVWDIEQVPPDNRLTLEVGPESLASLEQSVLALFKRSPEEQIRVLTGEGYGYGDVFFYAKGRYSPFRTCNQWTGEALRKAGIAAGYWTPFSQSISWVLGSDADDSGG